MRLLVIMLSLVITPTFAASEPNPPLFVVDTGLETRSISFENPTGARGAGGQAANPLGVGRKGAPARMLEPGEEVQLCDIEGNGTIRHIWMTTLSAPLFARGTVIRAWWDGQEHPSIECPLGDFFGYAHGKVVAYQSAVHSVGRNNALNLWLPMPFSKRARITLTNENPARMPLWYQVDYTLGDKHPDDVGRLHTLFRRENPTTQKQDFELLTGRRGSGRYIGTVMGIRVEDQRWWGEGEVKMYLDCDGEFATIVGTGAEDYVGLSFGMQDTPYLYHGCSLNDNGFISMYRWHLPDPVYWKQDIRVTIQQIGHLGTSMNMDEYMNQLYEREDDWSAATFWYEPIPSAPLPELPNRDARMKDLYKAK